MADFCLDCWNKINKTNDSGRKYILTEDLELCEGCGEWKRVIIAKRNSYYMYELRYVTFPIEIIGDFIYLLLRLFMLLCSFFKRKILKK